MFWQTKMNNSKKSIPNAKIQTLAEPPKESVAKGYKLVWRLLLISNLALGAYIFSRPRKNEAVKKDRKGTTKVPVSPPETTTNSISEEASIANPIPADSLKTEEAFIADPIPDSSKINEPISESQWSKVFKW